MSHLPMAPTGTSADPLHLAAVFNLSSTTAIAYADIARALLERPIEVPPLDQ